MNYGRAEVGECGSDYQDLTRQDVEEEITGMYWQRVLVITTTLRGASLLSEVTNG